MCRETPHCHGLEEFLEHHQNRMFQNGLIKKQISRIEQVKFPVRYNLSGNVIANLGLFINSPELSGNQRNLRVTMRFDRLIKEHTDE